MKTRNTCNKKSAFHHQNQDRLVTFCFIFRSHKLMSILQGYVSTQEGKLQPRKVKTGQSYLSALFVPRDKWWRVTSGRTLELQLLATSHPAQLG